MPKLQVQVDPRMKDKFASYPKAVKPKMNALRKLVLQAAKELEDVSEIEETLKWGEPSYLVKKGSTVRMDWKEKNPDQYQLYFKCTSKLVETFRKVYGKRFNYENNRALVFDLKEELPKEEIKQCIKAALRYHHVKNEKNLGIQKKGKETIKRIAPSVSKAAVKKSNKGGKQEEAYHHAAAKVKGAVESKLFGKPCYKIEKKAFCCFFEKDMVFKLTGKTHEKALALKGAKLFDPSGKKRPMKEWVQVPHKHGDEWLKLAKAAAKYVKP